MYTISVINQKGGVGKTVTTVNLAAALRAKGHTPLVIDYDPQMNATDWLMGRESNEEDTTIFDSLAATDGAESDRWRLSEVIQTSESVGVSFVPSDRRMAAASFDSVVGRSPLFPQQFHHRVAELRTEHAGTNGTVEHASTRAYDYCLVDCAPSLGRSIATALAGSDGVIIPIHADRFSMRGVRRLQDTVEKIRRVHNGDLRILGLLPNNLDLRSSMVRRLKEKLRNVYANIVFETTVPWRSKINEAATRGTNLMDTDSDAAGFYLDLVDEVVERSRIATAAA
jgi:chromosome partitioning protein